VSEAVRVVRGIVLIAFALAFGCAGNDPVAYSDFDPETDFSNYRTFSFISRHPLVLTTVDQGNPALEGYLMTEVKGYLTRKGFEYVPSKADADFVVGFAAGSRDTLNAAVYTGTYDHHIYWGRIRGTQVALQGGTEAGLAIDIFEEASARKKWMGWATGEMTMADEVELRATVRDIVAVILEPFPPEGPRP
jgi:hypothetical protein